MSLISQNAVTKLRKKKEALEEEEPNELLLAGAGEDPESEEELPRSDVVKGKKRRRERVDEREQQLENKPEMETKRLERFLFASLYNPLEFGKEIEADEDGKAGGSAPLFFMDKSADNDVVVYEEELRAEGGEEEEKAPAWVDDEEERAKINISNVNRLRKLRKETDEEVISGREYVSRLRAQHAKLNPWTDWALVGSKPAGYNASDGDSDDESGITVACGYEDGERDDILRTNDDLVMKSSTKLLPGLLEYSRLLDANAAELSNAPINSVQFHRNAQLLLTAGLDRRVRFFQIDGNRNPKIQSIFLEDCPIRKASFLPDGSRVILSGRRKFFYSFDLVKGKVDKIGPLIGREEKSLEVFEVSPDSNTIAFVGNEGYILLVSSKTKELIGTLKMNGSARSLAFADDGKLLLSSGGDGHIYHWDLRMRRCIHKAEDEGCITSSALATSPDSILFAAGSSSGIVNIYKRNAFLGGKRKPLKTIENLTTVVDSLKFNHDVQILAIISNMKKSSMKLVHIPSYTVFSNFPAPTSNLEYPRCLDFSPGGGFMAVGNAGGKILLYKLHHYQNA